MRRACDVTLMGGKRTCGPVHYHRASVATDLETVPHLDAVSAERERPRAGAGRGPAIALGLVVLGSLGLYTLLSLHIGGPRVHPDEERYVIAASSLVEGEGRNPYGGLNVGIVEVEARDETRVRFKLIGADAQTIFDSGFV